MKPSPFAYSAPETLEETLHVLARVGGDGKVLAGGQSLLPILNMRLAAPAHLVDINRVSELAFVRAEPGGVRAGALARHADVERDAAAYQVQPLLRQGLHLVAHPVIRNRGTTVGSLAHADPSGEMTAVLALTEGTVEVARAGETRTVPAEDFFLGPLESSVGPGELAVSAYFPAFAPRTGSTFLEVARRHGDYAVCGLAAAVTVAGDGTVARARAAYVSVAPTPLVLDLTEAVAGQPRDSADWSAAGALAESQTEPEADIHATADYRRHLVRVLTERALREAAGEGGMTEPTFAVTLHVNGVPRPVEVPARRLLSDCLRHDLRLTGTHVGCEHGVCGACTVLVDGRPMRSCLLLAVGMHDQEITTVEGLGGPDDMHPVQRAFRECHGLQCGFCTPGFLTTIAAFLTENPEPTEEEAREAVSGNLCRCTGYQNIVASVLRAAEISRERVVSRGQQ